MMLKTGTQFQGFMEPLRSHGPQVKNSHLAPSKHFHFFFEPVTLNADMTIV